MPTDDHPAYNLYTLFKEIFLLLDNSDRRLLQSFDLSTARFNALSHLAKHGDLSPSDLRTLLLCDKANVTRLLDGMERAGLVKRTQDKSDGRRTHITPSPDGEKLWHEAKQTHSTYISSRFECLSLEEQQTLRELLDRLKATLQQQLDSTQAGRARPSR